MDEKQAEEWVKQCLADYANTLPKSAGRAVALLASQAVTVLFDKSIEEDK